MMIRLLALCVAVAVAIPAEHDAPKRVVADALHDDDYIGRVVAQKLHERDVAAEEARKAQEAKDKELDSIASLIAEKVVVKKVVRACMGHGAACVCVQGGTKAQICADSCDQCSDSWCQEKSAMQPNDFKYLDVCYSGGKPDTSPSSPGTSPASPGNKPCFAKDSTTVCLLSSPTAECEHVLMADLSPGDLVLGRDGATTVVAVQHKAVDTVAEMLTFHTADGASVSMTPDHGVFADGQLVAAADAKVGAALSAGVIKRIVQGKAKIINAVTADGTVVADGVLAASNPMWIAALTVDAPLTRAVVNVALFAAGDVDSVASGFAVVLGKVIAALLVAALATKALKGYAGSH